MRLNGTGLNTLGLNAARRLSVKAEGTAAVGLAAEFLGQRTIHGQGLAPVALFDGDLTSRALRRGTADIPIVFDSHLAQQVARIGTGTVRAITLHGILHFARRQLGYGEIQIGFHARGDVGVVFGGGSAILAPLQAQLDGARVHHGKGSGAIEIVAALPPSAIRRPAVSNAEIVSKVYAQLEPSHINYEGIRYVGGFGELPIELQIADDGMKRQAYIGTMEMAFVAGQFVGTVKRPTLAGQAVHTIGLQEDFHARRSGQGSAPVSLVASMDGAVFVRGELLAPIVFTGKGTGSVKRPMVLGALPVTIHAFCELSRTHRGNGAAVLSIGMSGTGTTKHRGEGSMVIEALTFSDAVLNPDSHDIDSQVYMRPAIKRMYNRPMINRTFNR